MNGLFGVPLSGMATESKRLAVSAQNVANLGSTGVRSESAEEDGYVPQRVLATAGPQGGVRGQTVPKSPPSVLLYDPDAPDADEEGVVARPNVQLEEEVVTQIQAQRAYEANVQVLETMDEMVGTLLDMDT